jgi:hypothetical protein
MELTNKKLDYTISHYKVEIDTPHGKMLLNVQVQDDTHVTEHIENHNSDIWNKLTHEEKEEIDEILENEFIFH